MLDIINYESVIDWTEGTPIVKYKEMLTKEVISEMPVVALSMPYKRSEEEVLLGIDEEFEGKTNIEVANIRLAREAAGGDKEAYRMLLDRVLGKPKQEVKTTSVSVSYSEYLEKVTQEENEKIMEAQYEEL